MSTATAIRPFHVEIPEEDLDDLRQRVAATRWPDPETVPDQSQGVQLAGIQDLARYWGTDYDWRKAEAKLNALPQFVTTIDDLDIHFIHVRSAHPDAMPVIITHGWPGSVLELLKVIGPLTDPPAYGGRAEDAQKTTDIPVPVGVTVFPGELYRAPRSWTEQAYRHLIYFNEADKGGHFAAWEQPGVFSSELREAFRPLR
jgi:pimeloyl-ACP methyl ester carboxylesterase